MITATSSCQCLSSPSLPLGLLPSAAAPLHSAASASSPRQTPGSGASAPPTHCSRTTEQCKSITAVTDVFTSAGDSSRCNVKPTSKTAGTCDEGDVGNIRCIARIQRCYHIPALHVAAQHDEPCCSSISPVPAVCCYDACSVAVSLMLLLLLLLLLTCTCSQLPRCLHCSSTPAA
jgi:hypothetical protein